MSCWARSDFCRPYESARDAKLTQKVLTAAQEHRGTSFDEIYQNCNIFNDNAFVHFTDKKVKEDQQLVLEAGKPMLFGKNMARGIIMKNGRLAVATLGEGGITENDVLIHNPNDPDPSIAFWLSRFEPPDFPVAIGVLHKVERTTYDEGMTAQLEIAKDKKGPGDLHDLLHAGDTWTVK
ncbi:MAG: hypothetical protein R3C68_15095 [Myxococcota bacterium]